MTPHEIIPIFSTLWWQTNLATLFVLIAILWMAFRLKQNGNDNKLDKFTIVIGIILITRAIFIHPHDIYMGKWNIQSSLPLQLCGLSSILSGIVIFWRKQLAYECLFYWGIPGAFYSLLTPEFTQGMQGWNFYDYYVSHGGILLSAFYLTFVLGMRPRTGSWWKIFLFSQLLIPIVGLINYILDANYIYLCEVPIAENPMIMGTWPWYLLILEGFALIHFYLVYIIIIKLSKKTDITFGE